jgi:chitinase
MGSTPDDQHETDGDAPVDDDLFDDAPAERLSWMRLFALVALVAIVGVVAGTGLMRKRASSAAQPLQRSWSVPYVDTTLTPTYEFQDPQSNPARDIALAFVVADPKSACTPSWGGAYSLEGASQQLELDRRITQLRAAGGDIMVSFGGQTNAELATVCTDDDALVSAYRAVVERYDVRVIDLDIEGAAVADGPSIERRANAIAALQKEQAAAGKSLAVWLTVPVSTTGLTADGIALVRSTIEGGVDLNGVNAMTMNFGDADHPTADMLTATKQAIEDTVNQVSGIYSAEGLELGPAQSWAHVGATPMIGQNDVKGEVFTLEDAKGLADFAMAKGLGRVSTWSLNRDQPCGASFADVTVVSDTCSSVDQKPLDFANVFTVLPGRAPFQPPTGSVTVNERHQTADDQAKSPYPIWRPEAQYPEGYKVVRGGLVYQAKWYTQGQDPSATVANPWDTPWSLVGPVGPNDVPFTPTKLAPGTYPDWNPKTLYAKGATVLYDGLPYQARWPNQSAVPSSLFPVPPDSAWDPQFTVPGEPTGP